MKEEYLHFLWKYKRLASNNFISTDNDAIEVIDFGFHNLHSGPDFLNGKIIIDGITLIGSIEFHIKSSDWHKHKHQVDPAYNNVILHVVLEYDRDLWIEGTKIPTIELNHLIDWKHHEKFKSHLKNPDIACEKRLPELNELDWVEHLDSLSIGRIQRKLLENNRLLNFSGNDFHKLFMVLVGRTLGGKVNGKSFELLAERIESTHFAKLSGENHLYEAYVLGLAGMLDVEFVDEYPKYIKSEWNYLKRLLILSSLDTSVWKYGRLRPKGFPIVRLTQFANLLMIKETILESIENELTLREWKDLLDISFNNYWKKHVGLDKEGGEIVLSNSLIELLIVNTILPFRALVLSRKGLDFITYHEKILSELKPENNHIIKKWTRFRSNPISMFDSQGLIELYNEFCLEKECLNCKFGVKFMS